MWNYTMSISDRTGNNHRRTARMLISSFSSDPSSFWIRIQDIDALSKTLPIFRRQTDILDDPVLGQRVSLLRFEHLQEDLNQLCAVVGIDPIMLPNRRFHSLPEEQKAKSLSKEARERIRYHYEGDFPLWERISNAGPLIIADSCVR